MPSPVTDTDDTGNRDRVGNIGVCNEADIQQPGAQDGCGGYMSNGSNMHREQSGATHGPVMTVMVKSEGGAQNLSLW
jgi:hypothetical protein